MTSNLSVNRPRPKLELVEGTLMAGGLMSALVAGLLLNPPPSLDRWVLLAITVATGVALFYVLANYLQSQWTIELAGDFLEVSRWWDRCFGRSVRRMPLAEVRRFVVRRPDELDVEGSDVMPLRTFWWRTREFGELDALAARALIRVDVERPSLPSWFRGRK